RWVTPTGHGENTLPPAAFHRRASRRSTMRSAALATAVLGGATLLFGVLAAPANAHVSATPTGFGPQHANPHRHPMVGGPLRGGFNQDGGNWSGYVATGSGFSSVSASWNEPGVSCNSSNDLYAPWVGIDG